MKFGDDRTRDAVARLVLERGPQSAADLAEQLALSPAAIRRHLDALVTDGVLTEREPRPTPNRGRGRPARVYALTDRGRSVFPHAYDDLATTALRYLRETGGEAAVTAFAEEGGFVLGICNGFQILTEAGLLPGALRPNRSLSFVCRDVPLTVTATESPLLGRCEEGQELTIPVKHGDGCWFADDDLYGELERHGQIALRYGADANPNGARFDVAGVTNEAGNVLGLMPHPEHAVDPLLGSTDGAFVIGSLVDAARLSAAAIV